MERVQAKLVEEVAGDGDMRGVAHKRHRKHEVPKKEERTKKHKGPKKEEERTKKPKGHKKEERTKQHKGPKEEEERTKQHKGNLAMKLNGDEAMKLNGDEALKLKGAGSEQEGGKRGKTKLVTLRSPLPLEDVLIDELIEYMVCEPLKAHTEGDFSDVVFDEYFDPSISEVYKVKREFDANVIQQYRINGYADIQFTVNDEEEVNYDEELTYKEVNDEEELTYKEVNDEELTYELEVV